MPTIPSVVGIDLFCGVGGLTYGIQKAGIKVAAGIDVDPACEYPYSHNNGVPFIKADVRDLDGTDLAYLYPAGSVRLLAGCAPCRPFSSLRLGEDTSEQEDWGLLKEFARIVAQLKPDLVTMENVPRLADKRIFQEFLATLSSAGLHLAWGTVYCPPLGIPQHRKRLVLLGSRFGQISIPVGSLTADKYPTVRSAIASLPALASGEADPHDPLHKAKAHTGINVRRLRHSRPGGTWNDWPQDLRVKCHRKATGNTFHSVYGRMRWDEPSPTITTQAYNFGTGRFGHPDQDRSITLREAALLQTFPRHYRFVRPGEEVYLVTVGRLIGNAVPPRLALFIGKQLLKSLALATNHHKHEQNPTLQANP